jgi:Fe-S cluster assembly protein SufD
VSVDTAENAPAAGDLGLTEHSHIGGRTVYTTPESHLHPTGSADLAAHRVPSGKEEVWRFTPLRRLQGLHDETPLDGAGLTVASEGPVTVQAVTGADADALKGASGYLPIDRPGARAWNAVDTVWLVDVAAEYVADAPVVVTVTGAAAPRGSAGPQGVPAHLVIRAGHHAVADVVVLYSGAALLAENVEIIAGDGARLSVVVFHEWDDAAVHLSAHHLSVGRDAVLRHGVLSFGGDLVRTTVSVDYKAPGGDAELLGISFADAGQHLEQRLFVDHDAPHCKSNVLYKGALQGQAAHTVWVGDVLIRATAEGTDTYEMNRNLLLTDGARADSVPNLEIETGEIVGAGHASATGRFDDEQLFYLLSRGIPEDVARRLVVRGFFAEVLGKLGVPYVVERATGIVERELAITGI